MLKNLAALLAFFSLVLLITFGVQRSNGSSAKSTRLACHTQSVVFEKVYEPALLKNVREALANHNYTMSSSIEKAQYMKSQLFEYVDINTVDQIVINEIEAYRTDEKKKTETVKLNYFIYENDKNDPGKKTKKSKLYAGYLKFEIVYGGKRVYAIQIDFMDMQGEDIPQRVNCTIKSIMKEEA